MLRQIDFIDNPPIGFVFPFESVLEKVGVHFYHREEGRELSKINENWRITTYVRDRMNEHARYSDGSRKLIRGTFLIKSILLLLVLDRAGDDAIEQYDLIDDAFPIEASEYDHSIIKPYYRLLLDRMENVPYGKLIKYIIEKVDDTVCEASTSGMRGPYQKLSYHLTFFQCELKRTLAKELLFLNRDNPDWKDFIQFHWNLSSGENATLSFYSRLFHAQKELTTKEEAHFRSHPTATRARKKTLLILIDEGELYLHPQLQKDFIQSLVDYLPLIFEEYSIQVIITVHTPIVLSDLPGNNIVLLERGYGNTTTVDSKKEKQTFGANIFTLFEDSFFLRNGFVGSFATNKIREVIDIIKNKRSRTEGEIKYAAQIISLVGDTILKDVLLEQLYSDDEILN